MEKTVEKKRQLPYNDKEYIKERTGKKSRFKEMGRRDAPMQQLIQDLKNQSYKQMYLLYGEEDYLRKQYRDKLKAALVSDGDTMNYHYYEGKDIHVGEIIDLAETLPFFAEKRVIILENSGLCKSGGEELANYLKEPAESVVLILVETQVDKRSKLFKIIKENGRVCEFAAQNEMTLKKWIYSLARQEQKAIDELTIQHFLEKTGTEMSNIRTEWEKLMCYTLDREVVTPADIDAVCTQRVNNRIFEMVAAIAEKRQQEALDMYHDLLTLKEPPMGILALIARQFNLMLQVKELQLKRINSRQIADKVGLAPFIVQKYEKQAARFKVKELKDALSACADADEAVKTGRLNDVLSIELLIIERSR